MEITLLNRTAFFKIIKMIKNKISEVRNIFKNLNYYSKTTHVWHLLH